MHALLRERIETAIGSRILHATAVGGGDINQAYRLTLADGRDLFVKANAQAPKGLFGSEGRGLAWLEAANALRIPKVIAVAEEQDTTWLVLEYLPSAKPCSDYDERLGRGLAKLHRFGAPCFGLDHDNFIGSLPQANHPLPVWTAFYRERRLEPLLKRASDVRLVSTEMSRRFARLFARLDELCGPEEPPARLHGDLWSGNVKSAEPGVPALFDPAVYGGHREVDLAMMKLFGGFSARVFSAYDEAYPLAPANPERVALYQLYPLLVHVNLFGAGYLGQLERALAHYD